MSGAENSGLPWFFSVGFLALFLITAGAAAWAWRKRQYDFCYGMTLGSYVIGGLFVLMQFERGGNACVFAAVLWGCGACAIWLLGGLLVTFPPPARNHAA